MTAPGYIDSDAIREGSPLNPYRLGRTVKVDGFAYATTAPARGRTTLPVSHYVELADAQAWAEDQEPEPWCNHDAPAIDADGVCECGEIVRPVRLTRRVAESLLREVNAADAGHGLTGDGGMARDALRAALADAVEASR